jgi:hypothetical protein
VSRLRRRRQAVWSRAVCLLILCAAAAAAPLAAVAGVQRGSRLESPSLAEVARGPATLHDTLLSARTTRALTLRGSYWGGSFTARTGEPVTVYFSTSYPQDTAAAQKWADFLASLVHGSELSKLSAYLVTPREVASVCGEQALACYSRSDASLVAPGEDPDPEISAEAVITHEYGHHVAANRSNAPWPAVDWGTKRWASAQGVCADVRGRRVFPGAEISPGYRLNPGEGFAEAFRVLNERKLGVAEAPWRAVSRLFYPDSAALSALEQDVRDRWLAPTRTTRGASLTKKLRSRTFTLATPLDGRMRLKLSPPSGARVALDVYTTRPKRVAHLTGRKTLSVSRKVCGQRTLRVKVRRLSGRGTFQLVASIP